MLLTGREKVGLCPGTTYPPRSSSKDSLSLAKAKASPGVCPLPWEQPPPGGACAAERPPVRKGSPCGARG